MITWGVLLLMLLGCSSTTVTPNDDESTRESVALCDALAQVHRGQRLPVTISGIYEVGAESQLLYDPRERFCSTDIQPATWIEFSRTAISSDLDRVIAKDARAYVTFSGELYGPDSTKPDDERLPENVAAANRMSARYGHLNAFRTKFVVEAIKNVRAVPASVPTYVASYVEEQTVPVVLEAHTPRYPNRARRAGITGIVQVNVIIDAGKVAETKVVAGDRMLAAEAVAAIKTWTFDPAVTTTLTTTFSYRLERRPRGANPNPVIELQLPISVTITAKTDDW